MIGQTRNRINGCDEQEPERFTEHWQTEAAFSAAHIRTTETESTGDIRSEGTHIEPWVPRILERKHAATSSAR